jgi:hypothetical protein
MEPTYLVECYWPGLTVEAVAAADARARERAAVLRAQGSSVRFLGSLLVPGDEVAFFQFGGASADEVTRAAREAGLPLDRVVASLRLDATEHEQGQAAQTR